MKELFDRCLKAKYIHTAEGGDYAIEVEGGIIYLLFQWSNGANAGLWYSNGNNDASNSNSNIGGRLVYKPA